MGLAQNSARRASSFASFTLIAVGLACSSVPALAYDDESTVSSVLGLVGVSWDKSNEKIEYRERPKLVLPPNRQALPEPQSRAARPDAWPVEQQSVVQRRNPQAAARELTFQADSNQKTKGRRGVSDTAAGSNDASEKTAFTAAEEPKRSLLTEPPQGYRRPTKDLNSLPADPTEKASWSNPLGYLRETAGAVFRGDEYVVPGGAPDKQ